MLVKDCQLLAYRLEQKLYVAFGQQLGLRKSL